MSHTCGAKLRKDIKASEDGDAVACLRKAGAIPIAVTNIPELTCCYETRNDIIGYTNNPYDTNYTSGGTSGGEVYISAKFLIGRSLRLQFHYQFHGCIELLKNSKYPRAVNCI